VVSARLPDDTAIRVAEHVEKLRRIDDLFRDAKELGNAHVVMVLETARATARRQACGAGQSDAVVAQAVRARRLAEVAALAAAQRQALRARRQDEKLLQRKRDLAKASRAIARQRRFLARKRDRVAADQEPSSHVPKGFDAGDLGQGRAHGGTAKHRLARRAVFFRVVAGVPAVAGELAVNLERDVRKWDEAMRMRDSAA
jgi:hypothetical protein